MKTPFLSSSAKIFFKSSLGFSICAKTFVAVIIFGFLYFFFIFFTVCLSKYSNRVGIPFLIAIFPTFSGVTPSTLKSF